MFLTSKREDIVAAIARRLDCDPSAPETWPMDLIDVVIKEANWAAELRRDEMISRLGPSRQCSGK